MERAHCALQPTHLKSFEGRIFVTPIQTGGYFESTESVGLAIESEIEDHTSMGKPAFQLS